MVSGTISLRQLGDRLVKQAIALILLAGTHVCLAGESLGLRTEPLAEKGTEGIRACVVTSD